MFAIGVGVILVAFAIGIKLGDPGPRLNLADHVTRWGIFAGTVLCGASILQWLWRVMP